MDPGDTENMDPDNNERCRGVRLRSYGPVEATVNAGFNVQPNGMSAFWFELDCARGMEDTLVVMFDDYCLKTAFDGKILSALVPVELISRPGNVRLSLLYGQNHSSVIELGFRVNGGRAGWLQRMPALQLVKDVKPNFFIVGAPRCGTTSMYWRLSAHSDVYMSVKKESFYFDERAYGVIPEAVTGLEGYRELFKYCPVNAWIVGEATTTYLSSERAMKDIYKYNPHAKILIMLRDPIDASLSLYLRMREGGVYEDAPSFDKAWKEPQNRSFLNDHRSLFSYADQLESAMGIFDRNAIKVVLFDDLIADSISVYEDVLEFLGLSNDSAGNVKKGNSAKWSGIDEIVTHETYTDMVAYFRPQVDRLSQALGRDLSHWLRPYENY